MVFLIIQLMVALHLSIEIFVHEMESCCTIKRVQFTCTYVQSVRLLFMNGMFVGEFVQQEIQFYVYAVLSLAHLKNENKNR